MKNNLLILAAFTFLPHIYPEGDGTFSHHLQISKEGKVTELKHKEEELKSIPVPDNMKPVLTQASKEVELATLKKDNLILQLRLILKVPNEFIYDDQTMTFKPPSPPKEEKKEKETKP